MMQTKYALEGIGVSADVRLDEAPDVSRYDVVHVFNTLAMPAAYYQILNAKRQGKPVVLSTIYWSVGGLPDKHKLSAGFRRPLNRIARFLTGRELVSRDGLASEITCALYQEGALLASDCLLPNSRLELDQIHASFPRVKNRARIIPNGVSPDITEGDAAAFRRTRNISGDFVLCVGTISPRKNQLRLIQACRMLAYPVVLIGGCAEHDRAYLEACLKVAKGAAVFLGLVPQDQVRDAYAACRVHALASLVETPGLATLEAAACGRNVVVCDRGSVKEYLGDDAYYCDYYSVKSIAGALLEAWEADPPVSLSRRVVDNFTWARAGEETFAAYVDVVARYAGGALEERSYPRSEDS